MTVEPRDSSDSLPRFTRRRVYLFTIGACLASVLLAVGTALFARQFAGARWATPVSMLPSLLSLPIVFVFVIWSRRLHHRAIEQHGAICWECGYTLGGLGDEGCCPECGRAFNLADLRRRWKVPPPPLSAPEPADASRPARS